MVHKQVLLDENISPKLRHRLPGHTVVTTLYRGWGGKRNGELIALAENDGFDVFVTQDQNLSYQQNLKSRRMALVVICIKSRKAVSGQSASSKRRNNQEQIILDNSEIILAAIDAAKVNDYVEVVVEPATY